MKEIQVRTLYGELVWIKYKPEPELSKLQKVIRAIWVVLIWFGAAIAVLASGVY